jgi:threonine dehydrogenase-like Zn-dependent dehydrogenase
VESLATPISSNGYAGEQAEYAWVPFADVGPIKIENSLSDEQVLVLSDVLPTEYMAAEQCGVQEGDTVAVWGCGPVGLLTLKCASLLGAARVIGIDRLQERLDGRSEPADHPACW